MQSSLGRENGITGYQIPPFGGMAGPINLTVFIVSKPRGFYTPKFISMLYFCPCGAMVARDPPKVKVQSSSLCSGVLSFGLLTFCSSSRAYSSLETYVSIESSIQT